MYNYGSGARMRIITLDFETTYDKEYSLTKLTTEEYVRDPRFEALIVGIKEGDAPAYSEVGMDIGPALCKLKLEECAVIAHHAHFDGLILSHHYGVKPKVWIDTLSMARPYVDGSVSLAALVEWANLPAKGKEVTHALGKRLADFSSLELTRYRQYCENDVEITAALARKLFSMHSKQELRIIDMTIRMFTEPVLELDHELIQELYDRLVATKLSTLMLTGVSKDTLMSNVKFAQALRALGVEPQRKISLRTGKRTFAFAKTDAAMLALTEHPNEKVQALVAARLGMKSTLAETRAQRMLGMSARGAAPVYLHYCGARQTGRMSGGDKMNWQNNARNKPVTTNSVFDGTIITPKGKARFRELRDSIVVTDKGDYEAKKCHDVGLRDAIVAPPGHVLVVVDSSNIEARVLAWLAGQSDAIERFRTKQDPYCHMASVIYGRPITKEQDFQERHLGKTAVLGLGYGMGATKFKETCRQQGIEITEELATIVIGIFRNTYHRVVALWNTCYKHIAYMREGKQTWVVPDLIYTDTNCFVLPSGRKIRYPKLTYVQQTGEWIYTRDNTNTRLYGGKCVENIIQAVARDIVMEQTLNIHCAGYKVVLSAHDEAVMCVPEEQAEECLRFSLQTMRMPPAWIVGLPLDAEGGYHSTYGGAK